MTDRARLGRSKRGTANSVRLNATAFAGTTVLGFVARDEIANVAAPETGAVRGTRKQD